MTVRFGELYELRFQREGTKRAFRGHPFTLNHHAFTRNEEAAGEALNAYFAKHHLMAAVLNDEIYSKRDIARLEADTYEEKPGRWVVITDGPKDKTVSRWRAIVRNPNLDALQMIKRFVAENLFARKLPKVVIRYETASPTSAEKEGITAYHTLDGRHIKATRAMRWTNRDEVLKQIQADRIDKVSPEEA